jgi:hypothetical protein
MQLEGLGKLIKVNYLIASYIYTNEEHCIHFNYEQKHLWRSDLAVDLVVITIVICMTYARQWCCRHQ